MNEEKQIALLMDIQEKVGRIDERLKKVEDTDRRASEALDKSKENDLRLDKLERRMNEIQESRKGMRATVWGAFLSAVVSLISVVATHLWG